MSLYQPSPNYGPRAGSGAPLTSSPTWMEHSTPQGSLPMLLPHAPKLCHRQLHLPRNPGAWYIGVTEHRSAWPWHSFRGCGSKVRRLPHGTECSVRAGQAFPARSGLQFGVNFVFLLFRCWSFVIRQIKLNCKNRTLIVLPVEPYAL